MYTDSKWNMVKWDAIFISEISQSKTKWEGCVLGTYFETDRALGRVSCYSPLKMRRANIC